MGLATVKKGTERMTLRLDATTMERLNEYHKKTEIPKTRIINKALNNYLDELEEDFEDGRLAAAAWEKFEKSDKRTYTIAEVREELGL